MSAPIKKFSATPIQVAVWENSRTNKEGKSFESYTVSLDKRYKDSDGKWQSSNSLRVSEIPKAMIALHKAYEYLALK